MRHGYGLVRRIFCLFLMMKRDMPCSGTALTAFRLRTCLPSNPAAIHPHAAAADAAAPAPAGAGRRRRRSKSVSRRHGVEPHTVRVGSYSGTGAEDILRGTEKDDGEKKETHVKCGKREVRRSSTLIVREDGDERAVFPLLRGLLNNFINKKRHWQPWLCGEPAAKAMKRRFGPEAAAAPGQ